MNPYLRHKHLKCVVLCAGGGARLCPSLKTAPKVMAPLNKKPILHYVIDYWQKFAPEFIFVVGYKKQKVTNFVNSLPIKATFVEQKRRRGIADAIYCVRDFVTEQFIVVLGDCLAKGNFKFPEDMVQGVGVCRSEEPEQIRQSYALNIKDNLVSGVKEKPRTLTNNLCGMGFYFFERRIFRYIAGTEASKLRNEIEITDVIQTMVNNQELISPVFFEGNYVNINYSADLKKAESIF